MVLWKMYVTKGEAECNCVLSGFYSDYLRLLAAVTHKFSHRYIYSCPLHSNYVLVFQAKETESNILSRISATDKKN